MWDWKGWNQFRRSHNVSGCLGVGNSKHDQDKIIMMMRMSLMILIMMTMVIHRNPGCMAKLGLVALPVQTLIKVFNLFHTFTRYIAAFKLMGERGVI